MTREEEQAQINSLCNEIHVMFHNMVMDEGQAAVMAGIKKLKIDKDHLKAEGLSPKSVKKAIKALVKYVGEEFKGY